MLCLAERRPYAPRRAAARDSLEEDGRAELIDRALPPPPSTAQDAMPCYAMPCHAMLYYAVLRRHLAQRRMLCYAMLCSAMHCHAMLCRATPPPLAPRQHATANPLHDEDCVDQTLLPPPPLAPSKAAPHGRLRRCGSDTLLLQSIA